MREVLWREPLRAVALLVVCACACVGQSAPVPSQPEAPVVSAPPATAKTPPAGKGATDPNQPAGTSKDRLFFLLPNFLTLENSAQVPPLTTGEKFKVVTRGSFDFAQFLWYGLVAGVGQARNSPSGYGQGAAGYGKRYGAAFADGTIENYFTSAIFPSLLRQDPRYFQSGKGGFWGRTGYAASRIVITRSDSGHNQFNTSEIAGGAVSATISTYSYHPDRNPSTALSIWAFQLGYDTLTYVVREFWPDIRRKLGGQKRKPTP